MGKIEFDIIPGSFINRSVFFQCYFKKPLFMNFEFVCDKTISKLPFFVCELKLESGRFFDFAGVQPERGRPDVFVLADAIILNSVLLLKERKFSTVNLISMALTQSFIVII